MSDRRSIPKPAGGWREPWPSAFELATALPADRWALVGGLMVQAHAMAADVQTTRVTLDVDAAVRVEARAYSYAEAAAALARLGYSIDESTRLAYRFTRGRDVVDLMVPDHEPSPQRFTRRDVMVVTGGRQALGRLQTIHLTHTETDVALPIPSLHAALVLKSAAHQVDSRDRDRHLLDAITLLACITDAAPILGDLRGSDRRRLRHIVRAVDASPLVVAQAPQDTLRLAQHTLEELRAALE